MTETFFGTVAFALGAGAATFFSPCAYALLPGYVGYYVSKGDTGVTGSFVRGLVASLGVLVVFTALFGLTVAVGASVEEYLVPLEIGVGAALVVLGGVLVADIDLGWHTRLPDRGSGVLDFFAFGIAYSVAAAGCVAPLFIAVVLRSVTLPTPEAVGVLGVYAVTFSVLMVGATVATAAGYEFGRESLPEYTDKAVRLAGVVVALAGLAQVYLVIYR